MKNTFAKVVALLAYVVMVVVNSLANILPINNRATGEISDSYPNLFAPAGLTFSIWGVIYLLLAGYVVYQFTKGAGKNKALLNKINPLFIATSIANSVWIFAWHYDYIALSVLFMAILLLLLIKIADAISKEELKKWDKLLIASPFAVYFGWITVATIANITVFLVKMEWNGFGIAEHIWTAIILLVGALIGILRMRKDKSFPYGLVLVWAYGGILLKHLSAGGFNGQYPSVIVATVLCLAFFVVFIAKQIATRR